PLRARDASARRMVHARPARPAHLLRRRPRRQLVARTRLHRRHRDEHGHLPQRARPRLPARRRQPHLPVLLGRLRRPVGSRAARAGLVAGPLAVLAAWLPDLRRPPVLAWPWFAPVGTLVTVTVALAVHALGSTHGPPADRGPQPGLDQPG